MVNGIRLPSSHFCRLVRLVSLFASRKGDNGVPLRVTGVFRREDVTGVLSLAGAREIGKH